MVLRIAILLFFLCNNALAKHLYPEKFYQAEWCNKNFGQAEVKLIDNTRIDCLTATHAIEFDFASKWAEAIGQSLHYARMTGKKPGIVLIIEKSDDFKYYNKIKPLCEQYEINLSYVKPPKNPPKQTTKPYNLESIIELIINFIKMLIKLFADF